MGHGISTSLGISVKELTIICGRDICVVWGEWRGNWTVNYTCTQIKYFHILWLKSI